MIDENLDDLKVVADFFGVSIEDAEKMVPLLKAAMLDGSEQDAPMDAPKEQEVTMSDEVPTAKPSKIKCKCCGFYKKPKKVLRETGVCAVCTTALQSTPDGEPVEVIGRMGKAGRNSVSIAANGRRWKVKRLSSKHSERIAARYASKGKGYAKKPKRTGNAPKGLPTNSRLRDDERG